MKFKLAAAYLLIPSIALAVDDQNGVHSNTQAQDEEELVTIGSRRSGDYTIITEDAEKLVETAGALGDPLGAIFALPGVIYSDGQEPAVRGSSPNDNIFVVDFLPASYIFHEFGVSVFSEFILHDFQMYSAGFGPEYTGATGAVFDVTLREPENKPIETTLDVSMLRSGVFVEGAVTENSAFYLSARRSLIDLFIQEEDEPEDGIRIKEAPRDTDYQFKYAWNIDDNHRLSFSANGATDKAEAELTEEADFVASNPDFAGDARLEDKYSGQSLLWEFNGDEGTEFKLGYGRIDDESNIYWGDDYINEVGLKLDTLKGRYSMPLGNQFRVAVGAEISDFEWDYFLDQVLFICTEFDPDCDLRRGDRIQTRSTFELTDTSYYIDGTWMPTDTLTFDLGMQFQKNDFTDEEFIHPRFAAAWKVADKTTLTAKAGSYNRFADLETVLPETGNPQLNSPQAEHFTFGVLQELDDGWSVSVEAYHKTLTNLPLALGEDDPDQELRYANDTEGEASGVDIMINKNLTDKWYGWLAVSYAKSERTNLRSNQTREYFLDTPLVLNWVMNYQYSQNFNIGWRWSVRSGEAHTPIVGVQENPFFDDSVLPVYGEPYSDRLPLYNRLDVRMKWDLTTFGKESAIILDIINALNYDNISERNLDYDRVDAPGDDVVTIDSKEIGFQPALTYRVTF